MVLQTTVPLVWKGNMFFFVFFFCVFFYTRIHTKQTQHTQSKLEAMFHWNWKRGGKYGLYFTNLKKENKFEITKETLLEDIEGIGIDTAILGDLFNQSELLFDDASNDLFVIYPNVFELAKNKLKECNDLNTSYALYNEESVHWCVANFMEKWQNLTDIEHLFENCNIFTNTTQCISLNPPLPVSYSKDHFIKVKIVNMKPGDDIEIVFATMINNCNMHITMPQYNIPLLHGKRILLGFESNKLKQMFQSEINQCQQNQGFNLVFLILIVVIVYVCVCVCVGLQQLKLEELNFAWEQIIKQKTLIEHNLVHKQQQEAMMDQNEKEKNAILHKKSKTNKKKKRLNVFMPRKWSRK